MKKSGIPMRCTDTPSSPAPARASSTAAPKPPARTFSSTVTIRPMPCAVSKRRSVSSGFTKIGLTTRHDMPLSASISAASRDALTDLPSAKIATSLPSLTTTPLSKGQFLEAGVQRRAHGSPPCYADGERPFVLVGSVDEMLKLVFVHGRRHHGVGETTQIGDVERAVVRLAVLSDDARAIGDELDRKVRQTDVVYDLVERALEEGGVDRDEGIETVGGHPGRHADGVLLGDADIEHPIGEFAPNVPRGPCLRALPR